MTPETQSSIRHANRSSPEREMAVSRAPKSARYRRWAALLLLPALATVSLIVKSQASPPNIPPVLLSSEPLYAATAGDKPAMALALSVEFPTVGAQYRGSNDYSNSKEFIGYYDAESCYTYKDKPTETPQAGETIGDYKRFDRIGPATNRMCADAFSGNFLNWASNSAIDMLRLALTGGDRSVDTADLTLLQRAFLPNGGSNEGGCYFNNTSYFPGKQLRRSPGGGIPQFFGAVPQSMATQAGNNDIWIGNSLNRIYFGTAKSANSDCSAAATGTYTLGTTQPEVGPKTYGPGSIPSGFPATVSCAYNASCGDGGLNEVLFGRSSEATKWVSYVISGTVACNQTSFPGGSTSSSSACYVRPYTGTWVPTTQALSSDAFFYARVQVCDSDTSSALRDFRDYGLCRRYPNGKFKPAGVIQKYSDQLRLAAFGYLMDQAQLNNASSRYGGVLRAPMKYVGTKTFDEVGTDNTPTGGNPRAEWDASTGVFNQDPEGPTATFGASGVINYLNKFGRTGPIPGRYKRYDPVGELYGEALRYLQGLGPTPDAISSLPASLTDPIYDGFPVSTTWTDPYGGARSNTADYACMKSNIVVIGDINTWDSTRLLTRTANLANNLPDFNYWNQVVRNFEAGLTTSYVDGQGVTRTTGNPNAANTQSQVGANGTQNTLIGSAYWAHTHDIRGADWTARPDLQRRGLRARTFLFDVNENSASYDAANPNDAGKQSYRRNRNQYFTASKYGGFEIDPTNSQKLPFNTFGNPFKRQDGTNDNDVWQDPTAPGEASTYYLQSDARGVLSAFDAIFQRSSTTARSIAGGAFQASNLTQAGNTIYQGTFDTADWTGDLLAIPINVASNNAVSVGTTPTWTASDRLKIATSRNIIVGRPGATTNPKARQFTWAAIDPALAADLNKPAPTSANDGLAQDRLNFLRGDQSKEGTIFRKRSKLMGDVVNSAVVFSGAPSRAVQSPTYATFYQANLGRTPAVFVGANDGMLHAFNANTGDELFAFIPSWMGPKLSALTNPSYVNSHQSYVDGSPAVAEAEVGSNWKTVLVAGTGGGGTGVFALDVTNPAAFTASNAMWEFTRADDADMGYVIGKPRILKFRTSAPGAAPTYRWFAAVPSGVNNYVPDSSGVFSTTGSPALFLLALDKGPTAPWVLGSNYYKISLPFDSTLATSNATGVVNFSVNTGYAREVTTAYMGDLHGRVWKLDFSLHGANEWNMSYLSAFSKPFFIATESSAPTAKVQPITMAPTLISGAGSESIYVSFGTGSYRSLADKLSTQKQSVYTLFDIGTAAGASSTSVIAGRGRLKGGSVNASTGAVTIGPFVWGRAASDSDASQRSGWYFDLPSAGERQVSDATVAGDNLIFGSLIPGSTSVSGACGDAGGGGNRYSVNVDTGNGYATGSTVGIMGPPTVMEVTSATTYGDSGSTARRTKTVTSVTIESGSTGVTATTPSTYQVRAARLSWRQIHNYVDLKNAP